MKITDNIFIHLNNPMEEFTLGIHNEKTMVVDTENFDESMINYEDFKEGYRLVIGFLIFSIIIIYGTEK